MTLTAPALIPSSYTPPLFTPRQRVVLEALARVVVPQAFDVGAATSADIVTLVDERLRAAPAGQRGEFLLVLRLLDSRLVRLACGVSLARWETLDVATRAARFAQLGASRRPLARTLHQAVRRLLVTVYYATPQGRGDIGVLPPLAGRLPAFPWEGPLAANGRTGGDEPIMRASRQAPVARPASGPPLAAGSITRGDALRGDVRMTAGAVVIGSGAGGAVAAARLAEAGRDVVILEEGSWVAPEELDEDEVQLMPRLFADQGMRATQDLGVSILQGAGVGGGTRVNWMIMLRTPDHVLEEWRRRFGLAALTPEALAPVFDRIEREVHASLVPDDAHSPSNRVLLDGARRLGWRVTSAMVNARGCVRAGTCSSGCAYGAKQDGVATFLPRAFGHGARLFADSSVARIEVLERATHGVRHPRKRVHAVVRDARSGAVRATLTVDTPVVVLAAGAVETPAILQRSGMGGGGVGMWLRLHPTTCVMGEYEQATYPFGGMPLSAICDEFITSGRNGYGFWLECPAMSPVVAAAATSGFGDGHRSLMKRLLHTAPLIALVRDGADTGHSNGSVTVDRGGRPRIRYRVGTADTQTLVASLEAAARLHFACGAQEVRTLHTTPLRLTSERDLPRLRSARYAPNDLALFSAHVNGTCRMGTDPATSGATPEGERHGTRGVYVCDGSLLPTAPGVNPQETIMALATVVAEGIA